MKGVFKKNHPAEKKGASLGKLKQDSSLQLPPLAAGYAAFSNLGIYVFASKGEVPLVAAYCRRDITIVGAV